MRFISLYEFTIVSLPVEGIKYNMVWLQTGLDISLFFVFVLYWLKTKLSTSELNFSLR